MNIKVRFRPTYTGAVIATIVNKRHVAKIRHYLDGVERSSMGDSINWPFDGTIYMSEGMDTTIFLMNHCNFTGEDITDLKSGWPITKLVDDFVVLNMVGYSACDYVKL